jgi:hypothetical protein
VPSTRIAAGRASVSTFGVSGVLDSPDRARQSATTSVESIGDVIEPVTNEELDAAARNLKAFARARPWYVLKAPGRTSR